MRSPRLPADFAFSGGRVFRLCRLLFFPRSGSGVSLCGGRCPFPPAACVATEFRRFVDKLLIKTGAVVGLPAGYFLLLFRARFSAGGCRPGIKRERLCESGTMPVAVSSVMLCALLEPLPRRGGKACRGNESEDLPCRMGPPSSGRRTRCRCRKLSVKNRRSSFRLDGRSRLAGGMSECVRLAP